MKNSDFDQSAVYGVYTEMALYQRFTDFYVHSVHTTPVYAVYAVPKDEIEQNSIK